MMRTCAPRLDRPSAARLPRDGLPSRTGHFAVEPSFSWASGTSPSPSEDPLPVIEFAYEMASFRRLPLTVLHSSFSAQPVSIPREPEPDFSEERALISESLAGMSEKFPEVEVTVNLVRGFADHELIAASPSYDLVVVGHHRTTVLADLVHGSVAPMVLEHARGTVAVVPCLPMVAPRASAD